LEQISKVITFLGDKMGSKRVLVTGGCGFIGSHLVRELVDHNYIVDVVDDMRNGHLDAISDKGLKFRSVHVGMLRAFEDMHSFKTRTPGSVLVIEGDFASPEIVQLASTARWDVIFHLAAEPRVSLSVENPYMTNEVNVNSTLLLLQAIRNKNVKFIFSSSSAVYGDVENLPTQVDTPTSPKSPYGLQKLIIENYLQLFGNLFDQESVCLRYFNVYGPGQDGSSPYSTAISAWCSALKNKKQLRSDGDGTQTRDLVFVKDVARINRIAAESPYIFSGDVFNVGSGVSYSNNEVLEMLKKEFQDLNVQNAPARQGDVKDTLASIEDTTFAFDWEPKTSFEDGLNETLKWWNLK
jgi:UDP-glucose 4-epimerase